MQVRIPTDQQHLLPMFATDAVTTSLLTSSLPTNLEPMDMVMLEGCQEKMIDDGRVFLNAKTIRVVKPWRQVVADTGFMSKELVPMPLPTGRPFLIYSPAPDTPLLYDTVPGLHRISTWDLASVTWNNKATKGTERRLTITFEQRQWLNSSDAKPDTKPLNMRMTIWERSCNQLFAGGDLDMWKAIIRANPVPFYAVVSVDAQYTTSESVSLTTLAIHWDLRKHLEAKCIKVTAEQAQSLISSKSKGKKTARGLAPTDKDGLINISETGVMPLSSQNEWCFYVMTANGATSFEQLVQPMIVFAAAGEAAQAAAEAEEAAKPPTKKAKKVVSAVATATATANKK
jgi:hypothetical protein